MRLDHLSYATARGELADVVQRIGSELGAAFSDGGRHPRFGTRNFVLALAGGTYLEVVAALDHPAADAAPFGQAVKARMEAGGGWLGWCVRVDDISPVEERLGRPAVEGNRHRPDGVELRWRQVGVKGLQSDPQLPFFVQWEPGVEHPSAGASGNLHLDCLEIAGDPVRVREWLGDGTADPLEDVQVEWVAPHGTPGIVAAQFKTSKGVVRI